MPTTEERGHRPSKDAEREVVRFLSACREAWHAHFATLQRRAQAQIVTHLCTKGRGGAAVGELHGLVKQIFLLDDSTVKERILEIGRLELCRFDPPGDTLSTRTIVVPTEKLLTTFDRYLLAVGAQLRLTAATIDPACLIAPLESLSALQRATLLDALEACASPWRDALECIFDARSLSPARRIEAMRHLSGTSHATLLHMAVEHHYGLSPLAEPADGILADRMAAALLTLLGQNFQTTRDHIGYLIEIGLLDRRPGKALRVALAKAAAPQFEAALARAADRLPALAQRLADIAAKPGDFSALQPPSPPCVLRHQLLVVAPETAARRIVISAPAVTIGRLPPCDVLLAGGDVSRRHCRLEIVDRSALLTDLNSTNGTVVDGRRIAGTVPLLPGARVQIGSFTLIYDCVPVPAATSAEDADLAERTLRRSAESLAPHPTEAPPERADS